MKGTAIQSFSAELGLHIRTRITLVFSGNFYGSTAQYFLYEQVRLNRWINLVKATPHYVISIKSAERCVDQPTSMWLQVINETFPCRYYVSWSEPAAGFTLVVLGFNFAAFVYMLVAYLYVYHLTSADLQQSKIDFRGCYFKKLSRRE